MGTCFFVGVGTFFLVLFSEISKRIEIKEITANITLVIIPTIAATWTALTACTVLYTVAEMAIPNAFPKELAILYIPDASPTLLSGAATTAVSVDGVAYIPSPKPNKKNPINTVIVYIKSGKKVSPIMATPTSVMLVPHTIGFLAPVRCISFSPTRIIMSTVTK